MLKFFRKIRSLIKIYGSMHPSGTRQLCGKSGDLDVELDDIEAHESHLIRLAVREEDLKLVGESGYRALQVLLRDRNQEVTGGILGVTYWGYFQIGTVWVHPKHRTENHLVRMFEVAEREALRRGCSHAVLATHSFQQLPKVYESIGYEVVTVLPEFPAGHQRITMRKKLTDKAESREQLEEAASITEAAS